MTAPSGPSLLDAPKALVDRLRHGIPDARSEACLNCGTTLAGPFCAQCGQRDIPPYPSTREMFVDAFWELSGWDGRFASTARALFQRPGGLTTEFLEGRRARYISPLRLYLMASLLYFLIAALLPQKKPTGDFLVDTGIMKVSSTRSPSSTPGHAASGAPLGNAIIDSAVALQKSRPEQVNEAIGEAIANLEPLAAAKRDSILLQINRAPTLMRPFLRRAVLDPAGLKRGIFEAMPRLLFALVPVFAAIVALFYRRRRYPEHLYFAIHLHAFMFLSLTLVTLANLTRVSALHGAMQLVAMIWIPAYATLAFKRVYGGSTVGTIAKELGIGLLYATSGLVALLVTLYVVAVWG
jgi:hypothetical protein